MSYSLLEEQQNLNMDLSPRLIQYIKAVEFHDYHNVKPPISLKKQFQITKSDMEIINRHIYEKRMRNKHKKIGPNEQRSSHSRSAHYTNKCEPPIQKNQIKKNKIIGPNERHLSEQNSIDRSLLIYGPDESNPYTEFNETVKKSRNHVNKCDSNSCSIYTSVNDFDRSLMGEKLLRSKEIHPSAHNFNNLTKRDSNPWTYNNDYIDKKSPYTSDTRTINRLIINNNNNNKEECSTCNYVSNRGDLDPGDKIITHTRKVKKKKREYMDDNKIVDVDTMLRYGLDQNQKNNRGIDQNQKNNRGIDQNHQDIDHISSRVGNVDVESMMWHSEPSRIAKNRDLGGVSINRFDDIFVNIQENSVYPFDFPRGGINSRDPQLYQDQPARII